MKKQDKKFHSSAMAPCQKRVGHRQVSREQDCLRLEARDRDKEEGSGQGHGKGDPG